MKFKKSYSNAPNFRSAYKFAFGGDINRANSKLNIRLELDKCVACFPVNSSIILAIIV